MTTAIKLFFKTIQKNISDVRRTKVSILELAWVFLCIISYIYGRSLGLWSACLVVKMLRYSTMKIIVI